MEHSVMDGKYTIVFDEKTADFYAKRYGERWRELGGDGMVLAMLQEIDELKAPTNPTQLVCGKTTKYPLTMTLGEARNILNEHYDKGVHCPCCEGYVKMYRRTLYYKMAYPLISLYKHTGKCTEISVHINVFNPAAGGGDFAKVVY